MMEIFRKIDSHSHFGRSFLGPKNNIEDYVFQAKKIGIVACIVSSAPSPEVIENNKIYNPCIWELERNKIRYIQQRRNHSGKILSTTPVHINPYHEFNVYLFDLAKKRKDISIFVMPIYHPILDSKEEITSMLFNFPSVAIKLHGVATFTSPKDIPIYAVDALRKAGKPIVVHTDIFLKEPTTLLETAYNKCNPLDFTVWAKETGIKTFLTHGARLSEKAIKIAISSQNIMIGIAPDLLIESEPNRIFNSPDRYLKTLFTLAPPEKLLFDIDFGWNVKKRDHWEDLDWQAHERIEKVAKKVGIGKEGLRKIFYSNATRFFNL